MRVLLDECLPRRLKRLIVGHTALTVPEAGWASKRNGELLALAEDRFDVFVTADQNLTYQQNLAGKRIAIIVLAARTNRLDDLLPFVPVLLELLNSIQPGELRRVEL